MIKNKFFKTFLKLNATNEITSVLFVFCLLFIPHLLQAQTIDFNKIDLNEQSPNNETINNAELLTPEAVQRSIDGAISFLKQRQSNDGSWKEYPGYEPGTTSLCTLALLSAGLDKNDPTIAKALKYLRQFTAEMQNQTYPVSIQTMVFCLADPQTDQARIRENVDWLVSRQFRTNNVFNGGWAYFGIHQQYDRVDNSNSQFAILALYEAERIGISVDPTVWKTAENYWLKMQNEDGSWGYRASIQNLQTGNSGEGTGSMTCAGIAGLVICSGIRAKGGAAFEKESGEIQCCQDFDDSISERIDKGLNWLASHFSVQSNPGAVANSNVNIFYYLYGLERVGRLTANRFIGQNDWYREGAESLLRRKGTLSQFWNAQNDLKNNNAVSTAFALLFLSKGRWPVLVSKYKYGTNDSWNAHPNDLAHLTRHIEKNWGMNLIWQVIDSEKATVDDLIQTPILVINGTESPIPDDPNQKRRQVQALRGYLEQGGFIYAEALDQDQSFETGFLELMKEVLPEEGNELHLIAADHPIWSAEKIVPVDQQRPIYGIDYGCRTSVVYVPKVSLNNQEEPPSVFDVRPSLSCLWEIAKLVERHEPYPESVEHQISAALDIGINIFSYATNREMKFKEEIPLSLSDELADQKNYRNKIFAAILNQGNSSSCAPRAIPNLMKAIQNQLGIPTQTFVSKIRANSKELFDYPILFMHGRNTFSFSKEEQENLRHYLDRGGFLFANSICASSTFSTAFADEMQKIYPEESFQMQNVPLDDPVFSNEFGGFSIKNLEIQKAVRRSGQKIRSELIESPPELKGIQKDGRWIVLFSPYDISCALEKSGAIECSGYSQKSAFQLAVNVLLYAIEHL
ncbi:MAG: DUF4159 domain-containing protein [Planctomycetia bacterium]|nr:DUF4159 domain-containing protein [Planctomycetia bacterium]